MTVSYPVDDEFIRINAEVLDGEAAMNVRRYPHGEAVAGMVRREDYL